jgi:hypothetical protein
MKLAILRIFQKTGAAGNSWPSYLERLKPEMACVVKFV